MSFSTEPPSLSLAYVPDPCRDRMAPMKAKERMASRMVKRPTPSRSLGGLSADALPPDVDRLDLAQVRHVLQRVVPEHHEVRPRPRHQPP